MTVFYRGRLVIEEVTDMPRDGDRYPTTTTHTLAELTITDPEGPFAVVTQMQNHTGELANHYGSKVDKPEGYDDPTFIRLHGQTVQDPTCTNTTHDHSTSSCLGPVKEPENTNGHTRRIDSLHCRDCGVPRDRWATVQCEEDEDIHPWTSPPQAAGNLTKGNYEINANDPEDVPRRALIKPRPVRDNPQA